jgi:hypothetical protein
MVNHCVAVDHHESDLYVEDTETARLILTWYKKRKVTRFHNQVTRTTWINIPFAYAPFWEKKAKHVS